jgi:hypothetical protein
MKTFTTPKGTELPLTNLKGKDYLMVAYRLVWFREEHPDWTIKTECTDMSEQSCLFRAEIFNGPTLVSMGHKREHKAHFGDYEEKAETGAIGRALAHCGYGTQFAPDIHEEDRIVDSPIEPKKKLETVELRNGSIETVGIENYVIKVGKKYKGMRLKDVPIEELWQYANWLELQGQEKKKPLNGDALEFISALTAFTPPEVDSQEKLPF